jgi:FkbM family methyltransferase
LTSFLNNLLRRLATHVSPQNSIRKFIGHLWNIFVGMQRSVSIEINGDKFQFVPRFRSLTNIYEPITWKFMRQILSESQQFIDVGANIGFYTLLAMKMMGRNSRIVSFEPNPGTYDNLFKNVSMNLTNSAPQLHLAGVYDGQTNHINIQNDDSCCSSFQIASALDQTNANDSNITKIPSLKIDDLYFDTTLPTLIKLDVEGAEVGILRGATNFFKNMSNVLLVLAVHPEQMTDFNESIESLNIEIKKLNLLLVNQQGELVDSIQDELTEYFCTTEKKNLLKIMRLLKPC